MMIRDAGTAARTSWKPWAIACILVLAATGCSAGGDANDASGTPPPDVEAGLPDLLAAQEGSPPGRTQWTGPRGGRGSS